MRIRWVVLLLAWLPVAALGAGIGGNQSEIQAAIETGRLLQAEKMIGRLSDKERADAAGRMVLADLRLAQKQYQEALGLYLTLAAEDPANSHPVSRAGIAFLHLSATDQAVAALRQAIMLPGNDWKTWNALGVALDRKGDWAGSRSAYDRALQMSPGRAEILNNQGYSLLLQKRFAESLPLLERAALARPADGRVSLNLLLARSMTGNSPTRAADEGGAAWATRLNNAGYAAWLAGDLPRARSLLSQAIEASETNYEKAQGNLTLVEGR